MLRYYELVPGVAVSALIEIEPLTASLGAEVRGLDLRQVPGDPALGLQLRELLHRHLVLGFRLQFLDDDEQVALGATFGMPVVHVIEQALGRNRPWEEISDSPTKLPDRDGWHTDAPFLPQPPSVAILRALTVPAAGGDTLFANMHAAYDALSVGMRRILEGLDVSYPPNQGLAEYVQLHFGDDAARRVRELSGDGAVHPLIREHPVTGRPLVYFADGFADSIVGLHAAEGAVLRSFLVELPKNPNIQCRWRWHEGDVVMWDEVATQHYGAADHAGAERVMRRVLASSA